MRRAWEHLNPGTGQSSLFANTVVITDTALTPASCSTISELSVPSRRYDVPQPVYTESGNFIVPMDHPHTQPRTTLVRAEHILERSRSKRIRRTSYGHNTVCRTKHDTLARAIEIITVQAISSLGASSTMYRYGND